ncbi:hypothetical protein XENORESO_017749, partial [Xenotaenia resolanae]
MRSVSVVILMCLAGGLSTCQASFENNQTQEGKLTDEELENHMMEVEDKQTFDQGLQTLTVGESNTKFPEEACEPNIYTILKELGALEERQKATARALEETNRRLETSEKKVAALNSTLTEMRRTYEEQHQVAFSAALPTDGTIGPVNFLYPLVYKHVLSNVGSHYSPVT